MPQIFAVKVAVKFQSHRKTSKVDYFGAQFAGKGIAQIFDIVCCQNVTYFRICDKFLAEFRSVSSETKNGKKERKNGDEIQGRRLR